MNFFKRYIIVLIILIVLLSLILAFTNIDNKHGLGFFDLFMASIPIVIFPSIIIAVVLTFIWKWIDEARKKKT
jgi:uncharacterized BrkB/YihY/UPF0761 family membrane protein